MANPLQELLGDTFISNDGTGDKTFAECIAPNEVIGLLFGWSDYSSKWIREHLKQNYAEWKRQNKKIEIILICERDKFDGRSFEEYFKEDHGPWLAIPLKSPPIKAVTDKFNVNVHPSLLFVDSDGNLLDDRLRYGGCEFVEEFGADAANMLIKRELDPPAPKRAIKIHVPQPSPPRPPPPNSVVSAPASKKTSISCSNLCGRCRKLPSSTRIFCGNLCHARTPCWINTLCCFPVLLAQSIKIYFLPCIMVCLGRIITYIACCLCRTLCSGCYAFTDDEFPPDRSSLNLDDKAKEESIVWIRATELSGNKAHLFENGIKPSDVAQGALGDCWLIAAIACMAEFPGAIENCFCFVVYLCSFSISDSMPSEIQ